VTVLVPLSTKKGDVTQCALVDDADGDWALSFNWTLKTSGYAVRRDGRLQIRMHRELLGIPVGDPRIVDHINRNRLDNRRANLRIVTAAGNSQNASSVTMRAGKPVSSRFRNVYLRRDGWAVMVRSQGQMVWRGRFATEEEAAAFADEVRLQLMPFAQSDPAFLALRDQGMAA
jgi:hypothetical protein